MASESRDQGSVTVSLPPELEQWLDQQATELDVDRETVLVQLLASYRTVEDEDVSTVENAVSQEDIEPLVRDILRERLPALTDAIAERVGSGDGGLSEDDREELLADLEADLHDRLDVEDVSGLQSRLDDLEADYREKLDDVRKRVVQVKREADAKADADHSHADIDDALARLTTLEAELDGLSDLRQTVQRLERRLDEDHDERIADLETELDGVQSGLTSLRAEVEETDDERLGAVEDRLDDAQEKLQTVAWVVRDLREAVQGGGAAEQTLQHIKQSAAAADVRRASCANCGSGVEIGLLTEPSCPHCDATLSDVEPSKRRFGLGSATLTVAAGLESGADAGREDELDDIPTDRSEHR